MFAKPFRTKSNIQMKGSDKKKFRAEVKKSFPGLDETSLGDLVPVKEEILVSKVATHSGESVLVYFHAKTPLFFELEKRLFPSVYTLWKHPGLSETTFHTWPPVVKKIANGADLMLPGVIVDQSLGDKAYGKIAKGQPISVDTISNKAAFAVGTAALSSEDMYMAGGRGKGVKILHCYGDELWISGTRIEIPDFGPPDGLEFLDKKDGDDDDASQSDKEDNEDKEPEPGRELEDAENGSDEANGKEEASNGDERSPEIAAVDEKLEDLALVEGPEASSSSTEEDPRSPQEIMDERLELAFLQAWKTTAKKAELPILTSNFFRLHMVPQSQEAIDIKKSSYKKLSKFLSKMQKEGIITIKELQKGVESITGVNVGHEKILSHRVVKPVPKEVPDKEEEVLPCDRAYEPPIITELFMVSGAVLPFFKEVGIPKGQGLTASDLRRVVKEYVSANNLQNPENKTLVNLDPLLASAALASKGENGIVSLTWEDLTSRMQSKMSPGYSLQFPGAASATTHKGKLSPIELSVATRSGNKKVTLIYNLETFGIDPSELAHKCQVGVAASTSVHEAANRKAGAIEVLVQGNQVAFISKTLLQDYKIPRKYIKGLEAAVKPKKKGK